VNDLTNVVKEITLRADEIIDKNSIFMRIATRGADSNCKSILEFKSLNPANLEKIASNMPEINRATQSFGKKNTQVTSKLMSIHMLAQGPFRRIRQCLAQIESKRGAVKENVFKLQKDRIKLNRLLYRKQQLEKKIAEEEYPVEVKFDLEEIEIDIQKNLSGTSDGLLYIEGSLKEIGVYQEAYREIKESNNISDDWDELTMEEAEVEENVKAAFLNAVRDVISHGRINVGTHEYLEQFGINPITASVLVNNYVKSISESVKDDRLPDIKSLYNFLDQMGDTFKNEWKLAMERIGLKTLISKDFLYLSKDD